MTDNELNSIASIRGGFAELGINTESFMDKDLLRIVEGSLYFLVKTPMTVDYMLGALAFAGQMKLHSINFPKPEPIPQKSIAECCIPCSVGGGYCGGVLYVDIDGKIKCNECGREFEVKPKG